MQEITIPTPEQGLSGTSGTIAALAVQVFDQQGNTPNIPNGAMEVFVTGGTVQTDIYFTGSITTDIGNVKIEDKNDNYAVVPPANTVKTGATCALVVQPVDETGTPLRESTQAAIRDGIAVIYNNEGTLATGIGQNAQLSALNQLNLTVASSGTDPLTGYRITVDEEHAMLHAGKHFRSDFASPDVSSNGTYNIAIIAPASKQAHALATFNFEQETVINFFENPVLSAAGNPKTGYNSNRNSAATPLLRIYSDPIISANGAQLSNHHGGSGNIGGESRNASEIILATGGTYLYSVHNMNAGAQQFDVEIVWYEL